MWAKALIIQGAYIVYIAIFAWIHSRRIMKGFDPLRLGKAGNIWAKFMVSCATAWGMAIWWTDGMYMSNWYMLAVVGIIIFELGFLWFLFDILLNLMRGLSALYISTTNGKALDVWFDGDIFLQLLFKFLIMALGIAIIILSFKLM
jgi:hypothetical protein